jgi:hypothetical protein
MPRKLILTAALLALALLAVSAPALAQGSANDPAQAAASDFRAQNDLVAYEPPPWFLQGAFVARENEPRFVFASPEQFARSLGCPTAWLIEAAELKRLERVAKKGEPMEYSLYLEAKQPSGTVYWMFVALPYQSAQEWFQDRWTYHRSKAEGFYGKTQAGLQQAAAAGMWPKGELRYLVIDGQVSLEPPEELLTRQMSFPAVYDLAEGRKLGSPAAPAAAR